ncbi:MAG: hypothetical protein Fur0022_30940 [Anaerolineales bacterium]
MTPNPFLHGNPVPPSHFTNRTRDLRRLVNRTITGQSTAVVGEPRTGKTSLLEYLRAREMQAELYGHNAASLIFFYMDSHLLGPEFTQSQFWQNALSPLYDQIIAGKGENTRIAQAYRICVENQFGNFVLERLFGLVEQAKFRLVLLLDEFDTLLHHPILNSAEFFGGLRSLASRSRGALIMITASRQSLSVLNRETQEINWSGSPYFNFLDEIVLGPFDERSVSQLLMRAEDRFNAEDYQFLARVGGGHPYLLQVAASALWEAYEEESDAFQRRKYAGEELFDNAAAILTDTWRLWSKEMKKAFTVIALGHSSLMVGKSFDVGELTRELPALAPEVRTLLKQGYITEDAGYAAGYRIRPEAFLWWLSEELIRTVREGGPSSEVAFEDWLRVQEWDGLVKTGEKEQLNKAARALGGVLKDGIQTFIKAAAEGVAKGLTG